MSIIIPMMIGRRKLLHLTIRPDIYLAAKKYAAEQGVSVSSLVERLLGNLLGVGDNISVSISEAAEKTKLR